MTVPSGALAKKRRGRRRLFGLIATMIGLIAALAITEIILRVWDPLRLPAEDLRGFYRLDAESRIEVTPGWSGRQYVEKRLVAVNMNSMGLRGPEPVARTDGEKRVLMLGDSFVWGQGVDDDATIPARIEQALRKKGANVTVGNAGMYGTGPREWSYTFERHNAQFAPDIAVAVMYVGNDVLDTMQEPLSVVDGWLMTSGPAGVARDSWRFRMMVTSRVWNYVERMLQNNIESIALASVKPIGPGISLGEALFLDRDPARDSELPFLTEVEIRLEGHFASFARVTTGVPTFVVLLPAHEVVFRDYDELLKANNFDPKLYQRGRGHARLHRLLAAQGFEVIDLTQRMLGEPERKKLFFEVDWHFSPRGCQRVADWLLPEIEKRLK